MSTFTLNSITTKGLTIIAQLVAGSTLEFTRIAVGDGAMPSDKTPLTVTDLSHKLFDVDISKVEHNGNNSATVTGIFSNADKQEGFFYRELGLFAKDPKSQEEILYCYGNAGADAEWISPSGASSVIEKEVKITTLVGNAEHVTAAIKSGIYATQEEVEKELSTKADLDKTAEKGGRILAEQMRFDQDQTIYVDAAATEEGADGSENKPFKTIQAAIDSRYKGAAVIYIKIKPGTYNENITVPRSPGTAWYFTREGSSTITLNTIIVEECSYLLFENMTLAGPANDDSTIISIKNVSKFDLNTITVNGNNSATGIKFSNSRGILRNSNINNCAVSVAATDASFIYMKSNSGTNNTNALKAVCSVIMSDYYTPSAEKLFVNENGGYISVQGGAATIPSNYSQEYNLGDFSDVVELKNTILAEFGKLAPGEKRECWLNCNVGFGPYGSGQTLSLSIEKLTNTGNADGVIIFHSYYKAAITFMQIRNGAFVTEFPTETIPEIASQEEAEAQESQDNKKMMTALRTYQAIVAYFKKFLAAAVFTGIVRIQDAGKPSANANDNSVPTTSWVQALILSKVINSSAFKAYIVQDYLLEQNGYIKFGSWLGNLILQWGFTAYITGEKEQTLTFPLAFSTCLLAGSFTQIQSSGNSDCWFQTVSYSSKTCIVRRQAANEGIASRALIFAIGK